jgi:periplasmic divalent cation tolerance protein
MSRPEIVLVLSNVPAEQAEDMASTLIKERKAACVNLSPIRSVYRWNNEICVDQEITLIAKVSTAHSELCVQLIKNLHPYELPEILVIPVDTQRSYGPYLEWVLSEMQSK